jgi:hypothetical protein
VQGGSSLSSARTYATPTLHLSYTLLLSYSLSLTHSLSLSLSRTALYAAAVLRRGPP